MFCSTIRSSEKILDAADQISANARARKGWIGRGQGRLAEAGSAGERPGWDNGRWCGLNDRTLRVMCCFFVWGKHATPLPNNMRDPFQIL